jgi:hypothetical protein
MQFRLIFTVEVVTYIKKINEGMVKGFVPVLVP